MSVRQSRINLTVGESSDIRNLGILQGSGGFTASRALSILLVGREVEGNEEQEIRADYSHACERSKFFSGAFARIRHPWEVGRGEVGIGSEINEP
jgi:hypothetical protein